MRNTGHVLVLLWLAAPIALAAEFRIHLVNSQHEPVGKAAITLTSRQESSTEISNSSGTAVFANLSETKYNIKIAALGYKVWESQNYAVTSSQNRPLQITLSVGELACPPSLTVEYDNAQPRGAAVRGAVVDADSLGGINGATIKLRRSDVSGPAVTVRSRKRGTFDVMEINPGRYMVRVTKEGFKETDADLTVSAEDAAVVAIKLNLNHHIHICD